MQPEQEPAQGARNAAEGPQGDQKRGRKRILRALLHSGIVIGVGLLLSLMVKTWLLQVFYIPSGSMENTLLIGDQVMVGKLVPSPISLKRGDIVVFDDPGQWLPTSPVKRSPIASALNTALVFVGLKPVDEGHHIIKRVIGLPGDHVVCCNFKKLMINGVTLNEPYLYEGDTRGELPFNITVPAGRVWVMGDHRGVSGDSRAHDQGSGGVKGSVPVDEIDGRAFMVHWPIKHWSWLSNPSETFAKVPAATAR